MISVFVSTTGQVHEQCHIPNRPCEPQEDNFTGLFQLLGWLILPADDDIFYHDLFIWFQLNLCVLFE
jgi:hypothetical protein